MDPMEEFNNLQYGDFSPVKDFMTGANQALHEHPDQMSNLNDYTTSNDFDLDDYLFSDEVKLEESLFPELDISISSPNISSEDFFNSSGAMPAFSSLPIMGGDMSFPQHSSGEVSKDNVTIKLKKVRCPVQQEPPLVEVRQPTLKEALDMEQFQNIMDKLCEPDTLEDDTSFDDSGSDSSPVLSPVTDSYDGVVVGPMKRKRSRKRPTLSIDDRKARKKEQNKTAAQRYRLKKKLEGGELAKLLRQEENAQKELKATYKKLRNEVRLVRKLLREAFIIKGLISKDAFGASISQGSTGSTFLAP